jgi:hypothetical protein
MVGDATRIPIIQQKCKEVFGVEQVSRTLNSLECVARGWSITYSFPSSEGEQAKTVTKELFPIGSSFPSTKTITFDNKKGGLDLLVHYSDGAEILSGLPREVAKYAIKEGKNKHEKVSFILRVSNNIH